MPSKQSSRPKLQPRTLLTGLAFGESPRWRHDRLWISDWGAREIITVDPAGKSEVMARAPSFPSCIDFLRDGRLLMVSAYDGLLLRRQPDGSVVTHADLTGLSHHPWNDIVVDGRDNAYVNNIGFDLRAGEKFAKIRATVRCLWPLIAAAPTLPAMIDSTSVCRAFITPLPVVARTPR